MRCGHALGQARGRLCCARDSSHDQGPMSVIITIPRGRKTPQDVLKQYSSSFGETTCIRQHAALHVLVKVPALSRNALFNIARRFSTTDHVLLLADALLTLPTSTAHDSLATHLSTTRAIAPIIVPPQPMTPTSLSPSMVSNLPRGSGLLIARTGHPWCNDRVWAAACDWEEFSNCVWELYLTTDGGMLIMRDGWAINPLPSPSLTPNRKHEAPLVRL